jgi:hypothetical protein
MVQGAPCGKNGIRRGGIAAAKRRLDGAASRQSPALVSIESDHSDQPLILQQENNENTLMLFTGASPISLHVE